MFFHVWIGKIEFGADLYMYIWVYISWIVIRERVIKKFAAEHSNGTE